MNGQEFGYNENGFRYLGQSMSAKDAFSGAGAALEAAGIQLDISPGVTTVNEATGRRTHLIRGLTITTTRDVGGNPFVYVYSLGRAMVSAVNVDLSAARASTVESGKQATAVRIDHQSPTGLRRFPARQPPRRCLPPTSSRPPTAPRQPRPPHLTSRQLPRQRLRPTWARPRRTTPREWSASRLSGSSRLP